MPHKADVAVLGAGVAGCATAYYLARQGVKVVVVERDAVGSGASGYAVGGLNPLTGTGIAGPVQPLAEASFRLHRELWPVLQEVSGIDIQASMTEHVELCVDSGGKAGLLREMARWNTADGFGARWLEPEELLRLEPRISEEACGAVLVKSLGLLDSYRFTLALLRAAERRGAELLHAEAVGLRREGGRATGIQLADGEVTCDAAVIALGPWSGRASQWLGTDIPVGPLKGQILYVEGLSPPMPYHLYGPAIIVQKADGYLWVGATEEDVGFDTAQTAEAREHLIEESVRMMPNLERQRIMKQTVCLRPVTPDRMPLLGKAPGWDNVYLATAAEKKGILMGPAMGQATADLIVNGETALPITPFGVERFGD